MLNVDYLEFPKSIPGRTKLTRRPYVARGPRVWGYCSKVCKCAVPPDHLRSEISSTCNIPKHWKTRKQGKLFQ